MSELFPCPNPACTNWIPLGRDKCFRCGHSLATDAAQAQIDSDPEARHPLLVPALIAGALLVGAGAWWFTSWRAIHADKTLPVVTMTSPKGDVVRTASANVEIAGTVVDKYLDAVEVDGKRVEVAKGLFRVSVPVSAEAREVRIVARDKAGNKSAPKVIRVEQDKVSPEITMLMPTDGAVAVTRTLTVTGTASEDLSAANVGSTGGTVTGSSFTVDVPLSPGSNQLRVQITDLAGNTQHRDINVTLEERALPAGIKPEAGGFVAEIDGSRLLMVPAGTFPMGSADGGSDEKPVHQVTVSAFLMDAAPVTVGQYRKYMEAKGVPAPPAPPFDPKYYTDDANLEKPVVMTSWNDAKGYADWAGRRLPTEAEWEHAARGDDGRPYPWGSEAPSGTSGHCNLKGGEDGFPDTSPVGSFPKGNSPYGVQDMAGNVWQWTLDFYDASFYEHSEAKDPDGPKTGSQFTLRGGAFTSDPGDVRSANRYARGQEDRAPNIGFRTVADLP